MDWVNLIISLISGIAGGNIAGAALPADKNLGVLGNSISGIFGGAIGNYILQFLGFIAQAGILGPEGTAATPHLDLSSILANIGASGASGAILMAIVGWIKSSMLKQS